VKPMESMCDSCPFGHSVKQTALREGLRPGRFDEICQDVFHGRIFPCHKLTEFDDDTGEWMPSAKDRECAGSIEFRLRAIRNRERAERRAEKIRVRRGGRQVGVGRGTRC
jgi:hypothetical protein